MPKPSIAAPSDESRERARKLWAKFQRDEGVKHHTIDNWPVRLIESAERDTRELCAQRAEEIDEQLIDLLASDERDLNRFKQKLARITRALAERIRGKGES